MTQQAQFAIQAAKMRQQWGRYAARRYCQKRGVPLAVYRLACQLQATN